jgi:integrase/recombinase XerC
VVVRGGKGDRYREVPLNAPTRNAVRAWLSCRNDVAAPDERAFFVNRYGARLGVRSIDTIVRRIACESGLTMSPHVLRHTALTTLVRANHDLVLVAEIAGHRRLETTRRYTRPSLADRASALDVLDIDH